MFKTIARPDHSERILATPPQHCISLNEARMLKGILLEKLPQGSTVAILGALLSNTFRAGVSAD
jgi:hypothetical protein